MFWSRQFGSTRNSIQNKNRCWIFRFIAFDFRPFGFLGVCINIWIAVHCACVCQIANPNILTWVLWMSSLTIYDSLLAWNVVVYVDEGRKVHRELSIWCFRFLCMCFFCKLTYNQAWMWGALCEINQCSATVRIR